MFQINLNASFRLTTDADAPFVHKLTFVNNAYRDDMPLDQFLTILPFQLTNSGHTTFNSNLRGENWTHRGVLGFVAEDTANPIQFFEHLSYGQYTDLKSDLKTMNPNYSFSKKSGRNLDQSIEYIKEAIEGVPTADLLKSVGHMQDILSLDDFFTYFHKTEKGYIIAHKDMKKLSHLYPLFEKEMSEFPCYSLKDGYSKELLLFYKDDLFYVIEHKDTFRLKTFQPHEQTELIQCFESFFHETNESSSPRLSVEAFRSDHWTKYLETTATNVVMNSRLSDDFSFQRKTFKKLYNVTGRSRADVWSKSFDALEKSQPSLDYPFFGDMSNRYTEVSVSERNKEVIDVLNSENKEESFDTSVKLHLIRERRIFDTNAPFVKNSDKPFESPLYLFMMPDYGAIAKEVPPFSELFKKD